MVPPPPPFSSFVGLLYRAPAAGAPSPPVNPEAALEDPAWSATIDPNNVPSFAELSTDLFNGWEQAKETGVDWMFAMTHGNKVVGYHAPEAFTKVDTAPTPYDDKVLAFRNSTFHGLPINVEVDLSEAAKPITVITQRTAGIVAHRAANPASKFMPAPTVGTTRTHIKIVFIPYEVRHFHDEPRDYDYYVGTIEPFISAQGLSEKCKHYMGYWTAHAHCTTAEPGKSVLDTPEPTEVTNLAVQGRRFGRVHSLRLTYGATATTGTSTAVIQQVVSEIKVGFSSLVTSTEKNSAAAKAESARRRREVAEEKQQKIANSFGGSLVLERVIKNTGAETKDDLTATAREVIGMDKKADRHTCVTDAFDAVAKGRNWHRKIDSSFMDDDWLEQVLKQKHYGIKPDEQWDKRAMGNVFSFSELTPQMKHKKQLADIIRKYDASVTAADALALATVFVGLPRGSSLINYLRRQVCFSEVWLGKLHWQTKYLDAALTDLESVDDEIYTVGMMKPSESPMRGIYLAVLVNKELRQNWTKVFNGEPVDESSMKTTLFSDIVEGETHWEPRLLESIRDAMQLSRFCNVFAQDPHSSEFDSATVVQQQLLANQLRLDHVLNEVSQVRSVLASNPQGGSRSGSDDDSLSTLGMGSVGGQGGGGGSQGGGGGGQGGGSRSGPMTGKGVALNTHFCEAKFGGAYSKMLETKMLKREDPNKIISCQYIKKHAGGILPPLPTSKERDPKNKQTQMCPSYHILKQCNNTCGRAYDHVPYDHNGTHYTGLKKWSDKCIVTQGEMDTMLAANGGKITLE